MHQYLKAIGFEEISSKKEVDKLLRSIEKDFTHQTIVSYHDAADFCEYRKEYGQNMGIAVCGELDEEEHFNPEYYYPYFMGSGITTCSEVLIEKRFEKEQYIGICEDPKVGISLIFHLQNGLEYMREQHLGFKSKLSTEVTFSGLAISGKVLFPVMKSEEQQKSEREALRNRKQLLNAARSGDPFAMETLTLEDIDTYSQVSRRLIHEDVFSIVNTYFMPYGVECDLYSIMGEITAFKERKNLLTKRNVYQIKLDVNDMQFDVCVPKDQVMGELEVGRRFKATIWLQGYVDFQ